MSNLPPLLHAALMDLAEMSEDEFNHLTASIAGVDYYHSEEHLNKSFEASISDKEKAQRLSSFASAFAHKDGPDRKSPEELARSLVKPDNLSLDEAARDQLVNRFVQLVTIPQVVNSAEAARKERAGAHHLHGMTLDSGFKIAKTVAETGHTLVLQHEMTIRYGNPFSDESESVTIVIPVNTLREIREEIDNAIQATISLPETLRELNVRVWAESLTTDEGES